MTPSQSFRFLPVAFMKRGWVSDTWVLCNCLVFFKKNVALVGHPYGKAVTRKDSCPGRLLFAVIPLHCCAPLASLYWTEGGYGFAGNSGKHPKIHRTSVFLLLLIALLKKLQSCRQSVPAVFSVSAALFAVEMVCVGTSYLTYSSR